MGIEKRRKASGTLIFCNGFINGRQTRQAAAEFTVVPDRIVRCPTEKRDAVGAFGSIDS